MNFAAIHQAARDGRLYPSVILYGLNLEARQEAAIAIARTLLCELPVENRPCEADNLCRHCSRLGWPPEQFHPDFHVLERDLRTATSTAATKNFLANAYSAPFEARGQIFVLAEAESLSGGAADSLLKLLEEPPERSPRHFLLLTASHLALVRTLRSRSLTVYLGPSDVLPEAEIAPLAEAFGRVIDGFVASPSPIHLLSAAEVLSRAKGWEDPRARKPWAVAAAAVARYLEQAEIEASLRRDLLALAEELLDAPRMRVRGITQGRILEGLLSKHLARA